MKRTIATLTVIVAAALGAQGQTTINFPITGTYSFTGLTFTEASANLTVPGEEFNRARLLVGVSGVPTNVIITFSGFKLAGQGITSTLDYGGTVTRDGLDNMVDTTPPYDISEFNGRGALALNTGITSWNSTNNIASFNISVDGTLPAGAQIYYAVQYSYFSNQLNTAFGNVNLVAVPEPSAYAAAAGLLALFLWSSRRHLFKLAGARSSASGSGENGAA
jgi:hypothetical protein